MSSLGLCTFVMFERWSAPTVQILSTQGFIHYLISRWGVGKTLLTYLNAAVYTVYI